MEYLVTYQIEVDARNPIEAAMRAHKIITDTTDPGQRWSYNISPGRADEEETITLNRDGQLI